MSGETVSIEVQLAEISGQVTRAADAMARTERDVSELSGDMKQTREALIRIEGLNLPERLSSLSARVETTVTRIDAVEARLDAKDGEQKGAGNAIRVMWAVFGSLGTAAIVAAVKLIGV